MRKLKLTLLGLFVLSMVGCAATPNMDHSAYTSAVTQPEPGKALVIFMRPSALGFLINSVVYDDEKFIGMVPYNGMLPYMANPGAHQFMVVSEAADFMKADLEAGKTYYALVQPRMGVWRARFSLVPVHRGQLDSEEFKQWLADGKFVKNSDSAYSWAKQNQPSVQEKKAKYLATWNQKSESDKPYLRKEDGK